MTSRTLWRHFAISTLVGVVIAVLISLLSRPPDWVGNLIYSVTISWANWTLIDGGRLLLTKALRRAGALPPAPEHAPGYAWPGTGWMVAVVLIGAFFGYAIGAAAGNVLTGGRVAMPWVALARGDVSPLVIPIVAGALATVYFVLRGNVDRARANAEAAERLAAQTQLRLLQSQLEPHMLFNTLANLRALIVLDPLRAQQMLDRLIGFLRATLQASRAESQPLAAEFARIADYLALMQVRMGTRLQTRLDLPEPLAALPLPPLLLQPLVENAIRHGLEPQRAGGWLEVSAARDGTRLLLRVRDTGVGLGASLRADGDAAATTTAGTGFGLAQVHERLARLYGPAASLDLAAVSPTEGGGTLATLSLPIPP